ncbi:MAG: hypothetical protein E7562_03885 [Ruminococcaceae bacterium]|nr:hypothetical protein [Oscillospiraceae bacterium]
MNKSKINIFLIFVFLFLFVATIGIIISMNNIDKQTKETTTLYTATVSRIEITDTEKNISAEIHTEEYDTSLLISTNICKKIKLDDISNLKSGQTISFRVENIKANQMNKVEFINLISLKTDTKDIFSLEEYNKYIHDSAYPARIASIAMASLFLLISLFLFFKNKK